MRNSAPERKSATTPRMARSIDFREIGILAISLSVPDWVPKTQFKLAIER
jgi:hypothetical protein